MLRDARAHTLRRWATLLAMVALTIAACKGDQPQGPAGAAPATCASEAPCGRDALAWLEDTSNRFDKPNIECANNPAGICFGMSLYEVFVAFQVTYDPSQPRISAEDLTTCMAGAFNGASPVTIPGCSGPADCAAVYGGDWVVAVRNFQIPLNEYQLTSEYAAWVESTDAHGARVGVALEATDGAAALLRARRPVSRASWR